MTKMSEPNNASHSPSLNQEQLRMRVQQLYPAAGVYARMLAPYVKGLSLVAQEGATGGASGIERLIDSVAHDYDVNVELVSFRDRMKMSNRMHKAKITLSRGSVVAVTIEVYHDESEEDDWGWRVLSLDSSLA